MRILLKWIIFTLAIAITAYLLPGVHVANLAALILFAIILGIINVILRPILAILTLPLSVLTLGLFYIILNALLVLLASVIVPGFVIVNFWWALLFAVVLAVVNYLLQALERDIVRA